ncbi:MAG: DPP IV N-terminal domain-containing protein [Flavobacteriaceae bacterium]
MKKSILLIILSLIIFNSFSQQKELTLNDAVLGYYKGLYPKSMQSIQFVDTESYLYVEGDKFIIKGIENAINKTISLETIQKNYPELKRLPRLMHVDATKMTFKDNHSIVVYNYILDKEIMKISYDEKAQNIDFNQKTNQVAYTIDNNLYIATADDSKIAITINKDKNIVTGQAIARYEFGISKGTFWSPNGNFLAFYEKDETYVTNYPLVDVNTYPASLNNIKYPMAGEESELARIGIYNVALNEVSYLDIDNTDEHYLTNLSWSPDENLLLVAEVNRAQNNFKFNTYKVKNGELAKTIFEESNNRWVEPENDAVFLPNSTTDFLWLSERDGYKNLYLYSTKGKFKKQVTNFKFVIKSILGFDTTGENVIITTADKTGKETHIYKVNIKYGDITKITSTPGTHNAKLHGDYVIDNFSSTTIPREINLLSVGIVNKIELFKADNPLIDYKIGQTNYMTLKSNDGFDLHTRMIKPANFDPLKKYPVLVYVYGGTHAQMIRNSWLGGASLWMHWFATQKDYIVYTLDNRGSANRGFAFESIIHRKAGEAAMEDQLTGINFIKQLPYIDANRIAVHGWSYGGFMASSLLLRHPNVFTTAVAGGPVTDWKYYEIMYGERYMDTPQENPEGYANSRVGKYLENLGDNKLLLIHGSVDPTVVPQHSLTLLKESVDKNVQIDFFTYPMHPHNVRGKDRVHLMQKVLDYVEMFNN